MSEHALILQDEATQLDTTTKICHQRVDSHAEDNCNEPGQGKFSIRFFNCSERN